MEHIDAVLARRRADANAAATEEAARLAAEATVAEAAAVEAERLAAEAGARLAAERATTGAPKLTAAEAAVEEGAELEAQEQGSSVTRQQSLPSQQTDEQLQSLQQQMVL